MATSLPNTSNKKNLETFSLIWLDPTMNTSQQNADDQQQLRSSINYLKTFTDSNECEQYIRSLSHFDRVVLIVSGRLGQHIIPHIHHLRQLSSIYVYCMEKHRNLRWAREFTKVRGVMVNLNELVAEIRLDQTKRQHNKVDEPLAISIFNTNLDKEQSTTGLNGQFIHSQLMIDFLIRMKSTPIDIEELISLCQKEYHENDDQLAIIQEFSKEYSSDKSLWWYTRESFVYRLLNNALRVQNIELLFLFRFVIHDLGKQLQAHRCSSPVRVYRGQLMSKDELKELKQSAGELITMNSFLSTSLDRQLALSFLQESADLERVLFEIDANPLLDGVKPLANITSFSYFPREEEILFMIGSIFRIINIYCDENGLWIIQLSLCSDHDHDLKVIFNYMKAKHSRSKIDLISFSNLLEQMGKLDAAEKYCLRYLNQLSINDDKDIARCYWTLGSVAMDKGEYEPSLKWYDKALEIRLRTLKSDDEKLAFTYNAIAGVYNKKGDQKRALELYKKALEIFRQVFGEDDEHVAMCLNNMGTAYQIEKKYSDALEHYEKALSIRQKQLPADHSWLGTSHYNIANVHMHLGQLDVALEHLRISLQIYNKSLPSHHPDVARSLECIGVVHGMKSDNKEALVYLEKAASILRHTLPPTHRDVIEIEENIQKVLSRMTRK